MLWTIQGHQQVRLTLSFVRVHHMLDAQPFRPETSTEVSVTAMKTRDLRVSPSIPHPHS